MVVTKEVIKINIQKLATALSCSKTNSKKVKDEISEMIEYKEVEGEYNQKDVERLIRAINELLYDVDEINKILS